MLCSIVEFSDHQQIKKKSPTQTKIPPPVISSDTTRNRPSHQPTRSRSQSSRNSGRIPPSSFTQSVSSPQKIILSPLMSPLNCKSFTPFIDFPLPPLTESSNFLSSSTDSLSSSDSSSAPVPTIPPPFHYQSPRHTTHIPRLNKPVAFEIENIFIPQNSRNNVPRTEGGKFEAKNMTDNDNVTKLSKTKNGTSSSQELGKGYGLGSHSNKKTVKYKHLAALGNIPQDSDSEDQALYLTHSPAKKEQKSYQRSLHGMVRQTSPHISSKRYQKYNFRVNSQDLDKY